VAYKLLLRKKMMGIGMMGMIGDNVEKGQL